MHVVSLIAAKRDGRELTPAEIDFLVQGFAREEIPAYQMSAWAMAVYLRGMTGEETAALTGSMLRSGRTLHWPPGLAAVDKHSTGGVGDKVSLILAPLLAACGLHVPMISGRGLGATGGTLDKLEAISGFRTDLSLKEIQEQTERLGCVITGASPELAPADKRLYALRDVTATVASIPLITASIMSKKLAEGLTALVLDVKYGSGAFMKSLDQARLLAQSLVDTGRRMGVATTALLTDMHQPLGRMAGNAVEVAEALAVLAGSGPPDVVELTIRLGSELLQSVPGLTREAADRQLREHLNSGAAREKFEQLVRAQGGDLSGELPRAPARTLASPTSGYLQQVDTEALGLAIIRLGGGRQVMTDKIDPGVGLEILVRVGDQIERDQPLLRVFARGDDGARLQPDLLTALTIAEAPVPPRPLVADEVR